MGNIEHKRIVKIEPGNGWIAVYYNEDAEYDSIELIIDNIEYIVFWEAIELPGRDKVLSIQYLVHDSEGLVDAQGYVIEGIYAGFLGICKRKEFGENREGYMNMAEGDIYTKRNGKTQS